MNRGSGSLHIGSTHELTTYGIFTIHDGHKIITGYNHVRLEKATEGRYDTSSIICNSRDLMRTWLLMLDFRNNIIGQQTALYSHHFPLEVPLRKLSLLSTETSSQRSVERSVFVTYFSGKSKRINGRWRLFSASEARLRAFSRSMNELTIAYTQMGTVVKTDKYHIGTST